MHHKTIDLFQKSKMSQLEVIKTGDEIKAQTESLSSIPITRSEYSKTLEFGKDMLDQDAPLLNNRVDRL